MFRRRSLSHAFLLLLAIASLADAATRQYLAQAGAIPQIDSITVGGTWVAGDIANVKIGNSTLTLTLGSTTTATTDIATAIKNAINATSIDASLVGNEKRNAAGQLLGEFRDVEAITDPASSSVVLVRSKVAGIPFGTPSGGNMTVTKTSTSGTIARASVQAATGPWSWDNAVNWSGVALPANDDTIVFKDTSAGPLYGLPNGSLEVTVREYQSFTGSIGLQFLNPLGYTEYRQTHVKTDDSGSADILRHQFGIGDGAGSPRINWFFQDNSSGQTRVDVFGTGVSAEPGRKALNLVIRSDASSGGVNISRGSVDLRPQFGATSTVFESLSVGFITSQSTDADVAFGDDSSTGVSIIQSGGTLDIFDANGSGGQYGLQANGGVCKIGKLSEDMGGVSITNATVTWRASGTMASLSIGAGGVFDAEKTLSGFTATACDLIKGASLLDGFGLGTYTNGIDLNHCGVDDVTLRVGVHRRLTLGDAD